MTYEEKVWDTFIRAMKGDLRAQAEILYVDAMLNGDSRLIKEENKMLNFDKYREEVEKRAAWAVREGCKNPKPARLVLNEIIIGKGLPYMNGNELVDWLFEEYEPPLLENGDELKTGDWIMVRNSDEDKWSKEQFLFYYPYSSSDRNFACAYHDGVIGDGDYFTWKQARIPEDGE